MTGQLMTGRLMTGRLMTGRLRAAALALAAMGPAVLRGQDLAGLVEQLGAADATLRSRAYSALLQRRAPEIVPLLAKKIASFPLDGQSYGVYLLQQQPFDRTRATWLQLVDGAVPFLRGAGAAMLLRNGEPAHAGVLAALLQDGAAEVRQALINLVWGITDERVLAAERACVRAGQPGSIAVQALQHLVQQENGRSDATVAAVALLAGDQDHNLRAAALAYLVAAGENAHAPALAALLAAEPGQLWSVRTFLDRAARLDPAVVDAIAAALPRARPYEVGPTAALLQRHAPDKAVAALRALLTGNNAELRAPALEALAAIPGALEQKQLRELLDSGDPSQQLAAAATLRRMDDPSGLPVVIALLPRAPGGRKAEAARVLGGFRSRQAVPPLLELLDDPEFAVRQAAWTGLQAIWRDLLPYRRFDFARCGYDPAAPARAAGIAALRAFWERAAADR
jgi:HEAT repeat protein